MKEENKGTPHALIVQFRDPQHTGGSQSAAVRR